MGASRFPPTEGLRWRRTKIGGGRRESAGGGTGRSGVGDAAVLEAEGFEEDSADSLDDGAFDLLKRCVSGKLPERQRGREYAARACYAPGCASTTF
jgi:hypothetical protein